MPDYKWKPIEPLTQAERSIDLAEIRPLYDSWRAYKRRIQDSNQGQLADFTRRLVRRLSVETGILERLYDLDRGTTEALVAQGFTEELVTKSSTDVEPAQLIGVLRDQESAIQLVMDCIVGSRQLSKGLVHELHQILTRHQDLTQAVDQFGRQREVPLLKGRYKDQPNNPRRHDGSVHEYCPPVHVEAEMERLIVLTGDYGEEDPTIVASWFHHRFTQIHPYQDGNGRLARALTTMILLKSDLLPLVLDRDLRVEYINALESADSGDLTSLARLFARLERKAILEALSVDATADISTQRLLTTAVVESLAEKFASRRARQVAELRSVNAVALGLRSHARVVVGSALGEIERTVRQVGHTRSNVREGGADSGTGHWYKFEVVSSAKEAGKFANFAENHYFLKSTIRVDREQLAFVVSFHHVGRDLTGIMEATAFSKLESFEDSEDRESVEERFFVCSLEPFVFTNTTGLDEIKDAFARWLDQSLAVALKEFGDRL